MTDNATVQNVTVETTRFGPVEVPADHVVHMPQGMIGFPNLHRYVLLQHAPNSPFQWLQCVDRAQLAFVLVSPLIFDPKYEVRLGNAETKILEVKDAREVQIFTVVNIPHGKPQEMTANLKAPVVLNPDKRLAAQVVLDDPRYTLRHRLPK